MNKDELFKLIKEKTTIEDDELNKLYEDLKTKGKDEHGLEGEDLETWALSALRMYFKRQWASPAKKFEGIIIGATDITDFGAKKLFDFAKENYNNNPEEAILQGMTDEEGNPIYQTPDWKKGMHIDLEKDKSRSLILLTKQDGEDNYKAASLMLSYEHLNKEIPFFDKIKFRANISKNNTTDDFYALNSSTVTEFDIKEEKMTFEELKEELLKCFKDKLIDLPNLMTWHEENKENMNRLVIVKANIMRINKTADNIASNIIELDDPNMEFDPENPSVITCWVPKGININFSEYTPDVIVIGRTNVNEESGQLSINTYGLFVDEKWRITEKPKEINENNQEESEA